MGGTGSRALVFPGLVSLTDANLRAIASVQDRHLELAAQVCDFEPAAVVDEYGQRLPTMLHEALLAVGVIRVCEEQPRRWGAYSGLSAGCLPAVFAAGAISERGCFELIREINAAQSRSPYTGTTFVVLAASDGDAAQLTRLLEDRGFTSWLSIDLGDGLVGVSVPRGGANGLRRLFDKLGVLVLETADRAEHCPIATPQVEEFSKVLDTVEFFPIESPVVCPVTGNAVGPSPESVKRMLIEQWYGAVSLPKVLEGLRELDGTTAVDLVSPAKSVYVTRARKMLAGRAEHQLLALPE